MSDEKEKTWLAGAVNGDEHAFRALYDTYGPRIYSLGMHLTHSSMMAEELVQEVFEKLWKRRTSLNEVDNFPAYIRAMVRNTAGNHLKRMAHERLILGRIAREQASAEQPREMAMEQDQLRRIWKETIDSLSPRVREVYLLSRMEGLKNAEIAERLGISLYTVKEYLKSALAAIRTNMGTRLDLLVIAAMLYFTGEKIF
jgi:RNA polymerase sigma-70 factor (family 1)